MQQDLTLRPIPEPEPVDLSSTAGWWLWLIPVVLIGFLWYWWSRTPARKQPTPQQELDAVLLQAEEKSIAPRDRFVLLHQAVRKYLASFDYQWTSLSAAESLPAWQQLFPDRGELVQVLHHHWIEAESIVYGPTLVTDQQVADYAVHIGKLNTELESGQQRCNIKSLHPPATS